MNVRHFCHTLRQGVSNDTEEGKIVSAHFSPLPQAS
jgi:hypothetical protein